MRAHMRRLMAAAVGVAGWAAVATAAEPIPVSMPATPVSATAPADPIVSPSPAALAAPVAAPASPVVVAGSGGCGGGNCGGGVAGKYGGGLFSAIAIGGGTANPASCGCTASEKTFVFGSCRQFYNPTDTCGSGYGGLFGRHGGLGCGGCVTPILGTGAAGTHGICTYGSYNLR